MCNSMLVSKLQLKGKKYNFCCFLMSFMSFSVIVLSRKIPNCTFLTANMIIIYNTFFHWIFFWMAHSLYTFNRNNKAKLQKSPRGDVMKVLNLVPNLRILNSEYNSKNKTMTFPPSPPALQWVRAAFYKVLVNTSLTPTKEWPEVRGQLTELTVMSSGRPCREPQLAPGTRRDSLVSQPHQPLWHTHRGLPATQDTQLLSLPPEFQTASASQSDRWWVWVFVISEPLIGWRNQNLRKYVCSLEHLSGKKLEEFTIYFFKTSSAKTSPLWCHKEIWKLRFLPTSCKTIASVPFKMWTVESIQV